jgi:SAM-dependent methyltransferase
MIKRRQSRIFNLYRLFAPIYAPFRFFWTRMLTREAERYVDKIALPAAIHQTAEVLDLGCGPGSNLDRLQRLGLPFARYVGFDLSSAMLAASKSPKTVLVDFTRGNAHWLPFARGSFDVILSTWMFSHLYEPGQAVREAWRLLRPGGWLIIACFTRPPGLPGRLLDLIEPVFMMHCVSPDEVRTWSGLFDVKTFFGGYNVVACLHKK